MPDSLFSRLAPAARSWPHVLVGMIGVVAMTSLADGREPAGTVEFFENRIRPVLIEHCFKCHSSDAEEIGGALWLDSADAMLQGGDSGPAIQPGDVDASLLISAIRYESSEMPPTGKLPEQVIADFEAWVASGAIDPRKREAAPTQTRGEMAPTDIDLESAREFWAFKPLQTTMPPVADLSSAHGDASDEQAVAGPIDAYLLDRLRQANTVPNSDASPSVRLRRLTFDLIGLPPSIELQDRWLADPSPENWREIVDMLLASPQFGEHWGRHWLDVARYADSNGSDFNATFHDAWRYRDYVIDSFNRDRPFDEFVAQQVAGDLMSASNDQQRYDQIVATTFLMLGTKMLSERDKPKLEMDVVDEQIDTIGRAFLGLTLGCARCHDHKFDPIPTTDYYALAGIFRSTRSLQGESQKYVSTWPKTTLPVSDEVRTAFQEHEQALKRLRTALKEAETSLKTAQGSVQSSLDGVIVDDVNAKKVGNWVESTFYKHFIGKGYVHDNNSDRGKSSIVFSTRLPTDGTYEVRLSHSPGDSRSSRVAIKIATAQGDVELQLDGRKNTLPPMWSSLGKFAFSKSHDAVVTISNRDSDGYVIADAVQFIAEDANTANVDTYSQELVVKLSGQVAELTSRIKHLESQAPAPLPTAMAVAEHSKEKIADCAVCIRGEYNNLGPIVPRGFLQVCSGGSATISSPQGSGRLELAAWLTDPDHPLVSRVIVNRVWMHLMGEGIVRTVDNFGSRGERPSHPELLDAMAVRFVRGGWQFKPLICEIVCSSAYARSSDYSAESVSADPENRLWWRMPRRRIEAESVRDTMLVVAGRLDSRAMAEPMKSFGVLVSGNSASDSASVDGGPLGNRSIYQSVVRGYIPPLMTMLDAADPDLIVGRRPTTNVPSQALVLVNSPEIREWATAAATRATNHTMAFDERLRWLYRTSLQREPSERDIELAESFGLTQPNDEANWAEFITALFASTEFRLLD